MTDGVSQQGFWKKNTTSTDAVQKRRSVEIVFPKPAMTLLAHPVRAYLCCGKGQMTSDREKGKWDVEYTFWAGYEYLSMNRI